MKTEPLDRLVTAIKESKKYRHLSPSLVSRIGSRELLHRRNYRDALKATRNKLHQVAGAYSEIGLQYNKIMQRLQRHSTSGDRASFLAECRTTMAKHASTKERLSDLESFYGTLFAQIGRVTSVMDLACGLNPLSIPWMPLPADASYYAFDVYQDQADFLNAFFPLAGVRGHASVLDLGAEVPSVHADVALLLKTLPCLEQIDKNRSLALLQKINASHILVSYPKRSLGGKGKGMTENYDQQFRALVAQTGWDTERFDFTRELVFLIRR